MREQHTRSLNKQAAQMLLIKIYKPIVISGIATTSAIGLATPWGKVTTNSTSSIDRLKLEIHPINELKPENFRKATDIKSRLSVTPDSTKTSNALFKNRFFSPPPH